MLIIGSHVSFNKNNQLLGSLNEALSYGSNTFMFYTGAPQNTIRYDIDDNLTNLALQKMKESNVDVSKVIVHAPYIVNLANEINSSKHQFSINFLSKEIGRCEKLGIRYLVLHPGSHMGVGIDEGIKNIIDGLNKILKVGNVTILLETMSGKGTEIGSRFDELKRIIEGIEDKDKIGICLDTCHLHDSGYDVSNFDKLLEEFNEVINLNYIKCIHINDSKNTCGAKKDRHENIGYGYIGFDNMMKVIYNERLNNIPKILETPYINDKPPYKEEINMIKNRHFKDMK